MENNENKRVLSEAELNDLCELIAKHKFEDVHKAVEYDYKLTSINVIEDEDCGCVAEYNIYPSSPYYKNPYGYINHRIIVGGVTLLAKETTDGIKDVSAPADADYVLPQDTEVLEDCLSYNVTKNYLDIEDVVEQFEREWERKDIVDFIENKLRCKIYIEIEGTVYPLENGVNDFLEYNYYDEEIPEYKVMTKREAARKLADNIDIYCG